MDGCPVACEEVIKEVAPLPGGETAFQFASSAFSAARVLENERLYHSMKSSEDAEYLALSSVDRIVGVRTARHTRERAGGTAGAP